ncbi:hypothetical protein HS7_15160 [Sulfolobales archaeon HS-7]|nr:hypothetical protein HS7_15160 [Sulfolobales archaeon HS-7]
MKEMGYIWIYIMIFGIGMLFLSLLITSYIPLAVLSIGIISTSTVGLGLTGSEKEDSNELLLTSLVSNIEAIFRYYGKEQFYRLFVPSSLGANGMLLVNKIPESGIKKVNRELMNYFNEKEFGVFLETPGTIVVNEMQKMLTFNEDLGYILRKGMKDVFTVARDVKVNSLEDSTFEVRIYGPKPAKTYEILGFMQSMIAASIISEYTSKIAYIKEQKLERNILHITIGTL